MTPFRLILAISVLLIFPALADAIIYKVYPGGVMVPDPEAYVKVLTSPYSYMPGRRRASPAPMPQANPYVYVGNNPINKIDPLGLSEMDVNRIHSGYYGSIEVMNQQGLRHWYPPYNNVSRTLGIISRGRLGHPYLGCGEQADFVKNILEKKSYDDKWMFEWQGVALPPHQWLKAISNNPSDPIIADSTLKCNRFEVIEYLHRC